MDFCFSCGSKTDPDWVFCRSCGSDLNEDEEVEATPASAPPAAPKIELISRGWDVVDVETAELPADPLENDVLPAPLQPGTIEVTVDSVTVVEDDAVEAEPASPPPSTDPWDHLRPHGEIPPLQDRTTAAARVSQLAVLLVAFGALAAAGLHFYLNTLIDAFDDGTATSQEVTDFQMAADIGLIVTAGLAALAGLALIIWAIRTRAKSDFRPGKAGMVALISGAGGIALVATMVFATEQETVSDALAVNSLIVLGLGLIIVACLATVRTVGRIDLREPA